MTHLEIRNLSISLGNFRLEEINLQIGKGSYFILLGVSGAGKSMVLETIAGLVRPGKGQILLNGEDITTRKIQERSIGLVFQDHAVFPHMSVRENIAYALKGRIADKKERNAVVKAAALSLGIGDLLGRKPGTLSGGELQRVTLARTLVQKPEILLLDEPLASLDTMLKAGLRSLLRKINQEGQTIIHVTHDYEEALSLGTQIAVMHEGRILQTGTAEEVFTQPRSAFVAHFTGARNFYPAEFCRGSNEALILGKIQFRVQDDNLDGTGYVLVRSEDVFLSTAPVDTSATNNFKAVIRELAPTSRGIEVSLDIGIPVVALITKTSLVHMNLKQGDTCYLHFKATSVRCITSSYDSSLQSVEPIP